MHLQRGRIHGDQDVQIFTGSDDVAVGEMHLEAADATDAALRGADLGREVGQSDDVVALAGGFGSESATGELHAVAGISGEPHDYPADLLRHSDNLQ